MKRRFVIADQNAVSAEGHFQTYTDTLARAAREIGCDVLVLWNKRCQIESFSAPYDMRRTFSYTEGEAAAHNLLPYGEGHFGFELERALDPLQLGPQDLVIVHTCHFVELVEALDYLTMLPPARDLPTYHVVIRYDPDVFRYRMSRIMQRLDALSLSPLLREKIRFHSDTEQLANAFSKLFAVPFGICPIPIDLKRLLVALSETQSDKSHVRPLVASYLGTARSEKGYRELLDAIAFLREAYVSTDRLHFVIQCSDRSLKSEPGLSVYQKKLEEFLRAHGLDDKVHLIKEILDHEKYCALMARSDIVLLSYSPLSYRYRSSSVLVEAMAAGKVIVTREGSWMASQVGPDNAVCYSNALGLGPALAEAAERFAELSHGAGARQAEAIASGDPASLASYFIKHSTPRADADTRPVLLMIGDGEALAAGRCSAKVFLNRLNYCTKAGYRVRALLICCCADEDAELRRRIADALRPYALESTSIVSVRPTGDPGDKPSSMAQEPLAGVYLSRDLGKGLLESFGLGGKPIVREAGSDFADMTGVALIFSSARDLEAARARNPKLSNAYCAYPFPLRPPRLDDVAGPVNGFELIASANPLRPDIRIEMKPLFERSSRCAWLKSLHAVDILLVCPHAEDARWFLQGVYRPFLARRGALTLVIGDVGSNEDIDNVLFVGAVANRDPLYAAAKVVVVPSRRGEDATLELFEALAKGKPVVTTAAAASAAGVERLEAQDDTRTLAETIIGLLDSPARRARAAEHSYAAAERLGAAEASVALNMLFPAPSFARPATAIGEAEPHNFPDGPLEWGSAIRAANRFVRSYVANEPLDGLEELAALPDKGIGLVARVADRLIDRVSAPLLRVDGGLLARVTQLRQICGAAEVTRLADVVLEQRSAAARNGGCGPLLIFNRRFSGAVVAKGADSGLNNLQPKALGVAFERSLREYGAIGWEFVGDVGDEPDLVALDLLDGGEVRDAIVTQIVPLSSEAHVLGRRIFANWEFSNQGLVVRSEKTSRGWGMATRISDFMTRLFSGYRSPLHKWFAWAKANPLFDAEWYLSEYPEAAQSGVEAFRHYDRYGVRKGFDPSPLFSVNWYLDNQRELRETGENPLDHYFHFGAEGKYDPSPFFSGSRYLKANPDVRSWRLNPLLHYVEWGRREGREIYPSEPLRSHQSIMLPTIVASCGASWVELELKDEFQGDPLPIELYCGDRKLDVTICGAADRLRLRAFLPRSEIASGLIDLRVVQSAGRCVEICGLRTDWAAFDNGCALAHSAVQKR